MGKPDTPTVDPSFDWEHARKHALSKYRAPEWPEHVHGISVDGLCLIGIDADHKLYWDGQAVEIKRPLSLSFWQKAGAVITVLCALAATAASVTSTALDVLDHQGKGTAEKPLLDTSQTHGPGADQITPTIPSD